MTDHPTSAPTISAGSLSGFLGRTWWVHLIGGIAAVIFGILAFMEPGVALLVLGLYLAAFVLIDGILNVIGALQHRDRDGWWLVLIYGLLAVLLGGWLILTPPASMLAFVFMVAFFTIAIGLIQILLGFRLRREIQGEWILYVCGGLSVALGALILLRIGVGSLMVVYMIAAWAIAIGTMRIWLAFKVKKFATHA